VAGSVTAAENVAATVPADGAVTHKQRGKSGGAWPLLLPWRCWWRQRRQPRAGSGRQGERQARSADVTAHSVGDSCSRARDLRQTAGVAGAPMAGVVGATAAITAAAAAAASPDAWEWWVRRQWRRAVQPWQLPRRAAPAAGRGSSSSTRAEKQRPRRGKLRHPPPRTQLRQRRRPRGRGRTRRRLWRAVQP